MIHASTSIWDEQRSGKDSRSPATSSCTFIPEAKLTTPSSTSNGLMDAVDAENASRVFGIRLLLRFFLCRA
ncbi:hypothetical protein PoB_005850700 [Plakobranchus ocellatus]|uniref:Uncharacterized protein n=1 Tax=Plakobranchus ocellatus TaxID=259542 RepID=A0AAV4CKD9_9GAST|nr:hypothetical protein PoB_005850700 [Plakobranchus ocellatus]